MGRQGRQFHGTGGTGAASSARPRYHRRTLPRRTLLIAMIGLALCIAMPMLVAGTAAADDRPPGGQLSDPVVRAVDVAEPAIVRLATIYNAHITFTLCGQNVTLPSSGNGYVTGGTGSGAFISANGDILTADHVVDIAKTDLDQELFQDTQSSQDIATLLSTNADCHLSQPVTADQVAAGFVQYAGITYKTQYSAPQRLAWQNTGFTGTTSTASSQSFIQGLLAADHQTATVVASSPFTENDLAVLHVGLTDTPSIQLDNSTSVAVQDQLTIIGFPGNGDVTNDATDLLTPSVNTIAVSAIKTGDNGAKLIQVGGNVEHGDSGGPALDGAGHIVGIVSFGGPDTRGITAFLRSSNNAQTLFSGGGISTRPGSFEMAWQQAFSDYAATYTGHWHTAAQELTALSVRYPSFHAVQTYKDYATAAAQAETVPTDARQAVIELALAGIALLAVIALVLIVVLIARHNRRKSRRAALAESQTSFYGGSYPYGPPMTGYGGYGGYGPPSSTYGGYAPPNTFSPPAGSAATPAPYQTNQAPTHASAFAHTAVAVSSIASVAPEMEQGTVPPYGRMPEASASNQGPTAFPGATAFGTATLPPMGGQTAQPHAASWPSLTGSQQTGATGANVPWSNTVAAPPASTEERLPCANGHHMLASEIYCSVCGAPRRSVYPPQAQF